MKESALFVAVLVLGMFCSQTKAGQPLVVKSQDGKFLPAAASRWEKSGSDSYRFTLKTGLEANEIATDLANKIEPIQIQAPDSSTLVFSAPDLKENDLLHTLSGLEIEENKPVGDAMAALADLGSVGAPTMGDMSSAGSIRASKAIELPQADERRTHQENITGEIVGFEPCRPMPLFHIKVSSTPTSGQYQQQFKAGQVVAVRGYYKTQDNSNKPDPDDPRTKINLQSIRIPLGSTIFGKPMQQLDTGTWVLETIEVQ